MNFLKQNGEALARRDPVLKEMVFNHHHPLEEWEIVDTPTGAPTARWKGRFIHSRYHPKEEAKRLIKEKNETIWYGIFGGFGLGYHVEAFLERYPLAKALVVEPSPAAFLSALVSRNLEALIGTERVIFLVGAPPEKVNDYLESWGGVGVRVIYLRSVYDAHRSYYEELDKSVSTTLTREKINQRTLDRFGRRWIQNLLTNILPIARDNGVVRFRGLLKGLPALLVAAGPSLETLLPHVGAWQKRLVLFSVDTALHTLLRVGIEPDFVVTVDPQYWNSRHFDRCLMQKTILLSDPSAYPKVFRDETRPCLLCSSSFPLGRYLEALAGEEKGRMRSGGSVATATWSFAHLLGVDRVYCLGLDLGFPGKRSHARGTFFDVQAHTRSWREEPIESIGWHAIRAAGLVSKRANSGEEVLTDKRMEVYIRWLEERIGLDPHMRTYTLSQESVAIEGMLHVPEKSLRSLPERRQEIDTTLDKIRSYPFSLVPEKLTSLWSGISLLIEELMTLQDLAERGRQEIKGLLAKKSGLSQRKALRALQEIDEGISKSAGKGMAEFLLRPLISNILLAPHREGEASCVLERSADFYDALVETVVFYRHHLGKALARLPKH